MNILNWNIRGILGNWPELLNMANNYEVICLSETLLTLMNSNINLNSFNHIRADRDGITRAGGMIVYIKDCYQYLTITLDDVPDGVEYIAVKVYKNQYVFHIVSIYIPPDATLNQQGVTRLFNSIANLNNLILTGDFNAHNSAWGSDLSDNRGKHIADIINNYDLNILNSRTSGTRIFKDDFRGRFSSPDITFVTSDIFFKCQWKVLDARGSDHLPIVITINDPNLKFKKTFKRINIKKVIWNQFSNHLVNNFDYDNINLENYLNKYLDFISVIYEGLEAANAIFPHNNSPDCKKEPQGALWWNDQCKSLVDARRKAFHNYLNNASTENYDIFISKAKEATYGLKRAKRESFDKFCSSLNPNTPLDEVCWGIKNLKRRFLNDPVDSITEHRIDNNPLIQEAFDKISRRFVYSDNCSNSFDDHNFDENSLLCDDIMVDEVRVAIRNSKNKSAPGRDFITYQIVKQLPDTCVIWLTKLFNIILRTGNIPQEWRDYNVAFIPKGGNKGFRPIAMSNVFLKILERVINDRLMWWLESKNRIPRNFFGFRRNKSCYDCLSILRTDISLAQSRNCYLGVLSLDLQGAYDNVNAEKLCRILQRLNIPPHIIKFIFSVMSSRNLYGIYNQFIIGRRNTNKGLPQGSILSPLLFNIYISEINDHTTNDCRIISFADDILVYKSDQECINIKNAFTNAAINIEEWLHTLDLSISFNKSRFIIFSKNSRPVSSGSYSLQFNNSILNNADSFKYLGVIWDSNLKWVNHINYILNKTRKLLRIFFCIAKLNKGIHPTTSLLVYKQFVRPGLDWASFLFSESYPDKLKK